MITATHREFVKSRIQWGYSIDGEENWACSAGWGGDYIPANSHYGVPEISSINPSRENGTGIWAVLHLWAFAHDVKIINRNTVTYIEYGEKQELVPRGAL